jgi:hypothetical protein
VDSGLPVDAATPPACTGTLANCNGLPGDGCETDVTTDVGNCGACGHDCFGGTCTAGACAPAVIASALSSPIALTADLNNVYWTDSADNTVNQRSLATNTLTVLSTGQTNARGIAADGTHVYWALYRASGEIHRAPIGGGPTEVIVSAQPQSSYIAVDQTSVYWTNFTGTGSVMKAAKVPGATPIPLVTNETWPAFLSVDATHVYWNDWTNAGALVKVTLDGVTRTVLQSNVKSPFAMAKYGSSVFYVTDLGGDVVELSALDGSLTTAIATGERKPHSIAADASGVYWGNNQSGEIRFSAPGAAAPVTLASGQTGVSSIAVTANSVFWTTATSIVRLAK